MQAQQLSPVRVDISIYLEAVLSMLLLQGLFYYYFLLEVKDFSVLLCYRVEDHCRLFKIIQSRIYFEDKHFFSL